jgi:hypothetical protein
MIYEYPKTAATQFLCESPDATEQEAIAFALEQFPECEYSRAEFLYEWRELSGKDAAHQILVPQES